MFYLGGREKDDIAAISLFQVCEQTQGRILCALFSSFQCS